MKLIKSITAYLYFLTHEKGELQKCQCCGRFYTRQFFKLDAEYCNPVCHDFPFLKW